MATPDNERLVRHLAFLGKVGLLAFRDVVAREASKRRQTLEKILADNRNRFDSNGEHFFELFTPDVNADITTWSMSLLFLVIKKLFWYDLSCDDRSSLLTLINLRDEVNSTQVSLTEAEYEANRADIKQAIRKLASGLSQPTQERIQDALNSSGSAVIDVQTAVQQIRELNEYTPSMLDDLDAAFITLALASSGAENRCNNNQERASEHGRDSSSEIKHDREFSSSFEKLTTTVGRDDNVLEINASEHSLENGENVQDATCFEDLKTRDENFQAVHETDSEHNRDSHEVKRECHGELSSSFEELKPAGIKINYEMTVRKQVCTSNPGGQVNLETVESVYGNVTVNQDRESAVNPNERQTSGTEESYDHLTELNLTASAHDTESPECVERNQETGISSEQVFTSSGISDGSFIDVNVTASAHDTESPECVERNQETGISSEQVFTSSGIRDGSFIDVNGNEPSIQETEIQVSQLEREQEGNDQWLDSNGNVNLHLRQMIVQSQEAEPRNETRNMVRAISENHSTEIRGMVRDMIVIQKYGSQRLRYTWRDLQIRIKIESNIPNLADDADHALCRIINEILQQVNLVDALQETQQISDNTQLAVTNGDAGLANASPTQQGVENLLLERTTGMRDNVDEIVERVMSNLSENLERNPELVRLCFILLLRLSRLGGVYLMSAGKGCVLLMIKCKSFEALLQLFKFYNDDSFQQILDSIASTIESQRGGIIRIYRELTPESLESLKFSIEEELKNIPKERKGFIRTKYAGTADLCRIKRFLETEGKDICQQIQCQLSRLVGGGVCLSVSVDPLDLKQALDSTPDLTDLIGALIPRYS